jgi:hypothetical protein
MSITICYICSYIGIGSSGYHSTYIYIYIKFCKVIENVSEWEHLQGRTKTQLKANIDLMSVKIKVLQLDIQKPQNYAILGCHCH